MEIESQKGKVFTLVRHGTTHLNVQGKLRGWHDVSLDENGLREAEELGLALIDKGIECIITSDLLRAQQTARAITNATGAPIVLVTNILRPWHVGDLTGKDVLETLPILREHASDKPDVSLEGGESFNSFRNRFLGGVKELLKEYEGTHVALITHHRGDRTVAAWEATGFADDLSIDLDVFLQKGIEPATYRHIVTS